MKQNLHLYGVLLFFFVFLLIASSHSIRLLSTTKQGEEIKLMKITHEDIHAQIVEDDTSINDLMGLEACENGDDECVERRMASEVHLDYIYTQKHNKP